MTTTSDDTAPADSPAVRLRGVAKRFGWTWALDGVDLEVGRGELLALAGPNGAGKTTLLRVVATLTAPTRGEVEVLGRRPPDDLDAVRRRIGYLPARGYHYDDLTALENLRFASLMSGGTEWEAPATTALERVGLDEAADLRVRGFSSGMRKRLALGRLLLRSPRLALLDEPYSSLDRQGVGLVDDVVEELQDAGAAVVMASHQWGRALDAAERVVLLRRGRVAWSGTPGEHAAARGGPGDGTLRGGAPADTGSDAAGTSPGNGPGARRGAKDAGRPGGCATDAGGPDGYATDAGPPGGCATDAAAGTSPAGGPPTATDAPPTLGDELREIARRTGALLWKDLLIEARTKGAFNAMAFFAALVLVVFALAVGPDPELLRELAGGLLWVGIVFTGLLSLSRTFHSEELSGGLEGLELFPGPVRTIYLGKLLGNLVLLLVVEAVLFPTAAVLFQLDLAGRVLPLAGVAVLGTAGFSAVGTFYAALTLNLRAREVMLPLLVLPLLVPVLLGAVSSTAALLGAAPGTGTGGWIRLLVAFDVIYLVVCTWTFPVVLER